MTGLLRIFLCLLCFATPVFAQQEASDEDRGFLTELLENSLGGEGRDVRITGFRGALSSEASIDRISIADEQGIWLVLETLRLNWNRSALLRGRLEVQELSAETILLSRLPQPAPGEPPAAEASEFSLPDLPVSIQVDSLSANRIVLGAPVIGEAVELTLEASARLSGGSGALQMTAERVDGRTGRFIIDASYAADTQATGIMIDLSEGPGGIVSRLLALPGQPDVALQIAGEGPLDDFEATISVATDGQDRLSGTVTLAGDGAQPGSEAARRFTANLGGDVTALFAPEYRTFFGEDVSLVVAGRRTAEGALDLSEIALETDALQLSGEVALNRDNWPTLINLTGRIAPEDDTTVLLPIGGAPTRVGSVDLSVQYDRDAGDTWSARASVLDLIRGEMEVARIALDGRGILQGNVNAVGQVTADMNIAADGIAFGDEALQQAVGPEIEGSFAVEYVEDQPLRLTDLNLGGEDYALTGDVDVNALGEGLRTAFDLSIAAQSIERFSGLAGRSLGGQATLDIAGSTALGGAFDVVIAGNATDLRLDQSQADTVLAGTTRLDIAARRTLDGTVLERANVSNDQISVEASGRFATDDAFAEYDIRLNDSGLVIPDTTGPLLLDGTATQTPEGWSVLTMAEGPFDTTAQIAGRLAGETPEVAFQLNLPDVQPLVPQYSGALSVDGIATQRVDGWQVVADLAGPYDLSARVDAMATGPNPNVKYEVRLPDIRPLVPQFTGAVELDGTAEQTVEGWQIQTDVAGPYGLTASVAGRATGASPSIQYDVRLPDVNPLAPQYRGAATITGTAEQPDDDWIVNADLTGPYQSTARLRGVVTGPVRSLSYTVRVPDISPLVTDVNGSVVLDGTARESGDRWQVATVLDGPAGARAQIAGTVSNEGQLNVSAQGTAPLGLANPFITPRRISGNTRFALQIDGPASLNAVSGDITISGGRFADPNLRLAFEDIGGTINLQGSRAALDLTAQSTTSGRVTVSGTIGLAAPNPADLRVQLIRLGLVDPSLYETEVDGQVTLAGNLQGGARIAGDLELGRTTITVPSSGVGGFGIVPEVVHVNPSPRIAQTLARAGLEQVPEEQTGADRPGYALDLAIRAPSQIFVRGRGIDAELGGGLRLSGTTNNIVSAGRFELIRGRLDILEQRFTLDEGTIQLQGDFNPFLRFVAVTDTATGTASVVIEGSASSPEVRFESTPAAPQDEVLAQLFFGRDVSQLSAFQALQLANAVATLAGRGGNSIVSQLRRGFDLDDLDVTTNSDGGTAVRAGKYLSDNVYTDVTVGASTDSSVSLNIDLTSSITAKGTLGADGNTSLGVFFKRDY
ncbi:translocation/assembly module TamB domain-containing protein [Litoreibacter roseus]|uniref:Translocation/assembly module TamB n=1 Tax=Litoreibacter roseus TaxID=2601869 RepID=A0A6N6JE17_9RHOB|nr:translocation/assembly module TamB domain-containing protein [Litoreibacter roseus]GFE64456.1 translocation/assembly module TamB [Litoreibacter roseus]